MHTVYTVKTKEADDSIFHFLSHYVILVSTQVQPTDKVQVHSSEYKLRVLPSQSESIRSVHITILLAP